jgi:hypothetical protein
MAAKLILQKYEGSLASEFFRDLTATFDQLALPYTAVQFTVDGIEDRPGVGEKGRGLLICGSKVRALCDNQ